MFPQIPFCKPHHPKKFPFSLSVSLHRLKRTDIFFSFSVFIWAFWEACFLSESRGENRKARTFPLLYGPSTLLFLSTWVVHILFDSMPKKIKRVPLDSTPHGSYEDAKTRFKHQTLMQDYQDLQKEVEEKRSKLEVVGQRKLILLAEVRYLKRRYKNLVEYKCDNRSQGGLDQIRTSGTMFKSKMKNQIHSKKEAILHNVCPKVVSHQKGRLHIGKEATSRREKMRNFRIRNQ